MSKTALDEISKKAFMGEKECVEELLKHTKIFQDAADSIFKKAEEYVSIIRKSDKTSGVENFISQYGLSKKEGVMIMCLAESLLRIPDSTTANALIHDKFIDTNWEKYLGNSKSIFVNSSTWGLMLTGGLVKLGKKENSGSISKTIGSMVSRFSEPVIREALKKAMEILGTQFVVGNTIKKALAKGEILEGRGYMLSYDMLGEGARSEKQAEEFFNSYMEAAGEVGAVGTSKKLFENPGISVKLSALSPSYELVKEREVMENLLPRLKEIIRVAMESNISISIDAEESRRLDISLKVYDELLKDKEFKSYDGIGFVLQAYQKRAIPVLDYLHDKAKAGNRRLAVRLVKGAYWDSEIKYAQELGLEGYPVFTRKSHTDVSYLACASKLLDAQKQFYPQFASHNALSVASILEVAGNKEFEFQRLFGMGESFYEQLIGKMPIRIYAPVGKYEELLPYLIRRLLENGANTSFVNLVVDEKEPIGEILKNPLKRAKKTGGSPREDIPIPKKLYKDRKNSRGYDFGNSHHLSEISKKINNKNYRIGGIICGKELKGKEHEIKSPQDYKTTIGVAANTTKADIDKAIDAASKSFSKWNEMGVDARAKIIEKFADLLQKNEADILSLLVNEAGKTLKDSVSEIREAIDFCRYYAAKAREDFVPKELVGPTGEKNQLHLEGKGVFACISPWNFPLAIFAGQVVAALVTGNTVIAKPAEQTPLIANLAIKLLLEAGVPNDVIHLIIGDGAKTGSQITSNEKIVGVAFTGSTETAKNINLSLAKRDGPIATLIAETGGQNAMIVDSTCLPEQAVDDIIISAFGSSGQRCSALRVLYLQDDIAGKVIELLKGAMEKLKIGNPADPETDIGPVIDWEARKNLRSHIEKMKKTAKLIYACEPVELNGHFLEPHAFEIKSIDILTKEHFGPILHVVRYKSSDLEKVIEEINSSNFGLTFGLHSRIEGRMVEMLSKIKAGNIYVNRSMIGATVGVQPFGGMNLSGTGPKAGGPNYLHGFVNEKTFTVNVAAIGGNLELLTKEIQKT